MTLVEIPLRQLHQGVSRQPSHVRFPGQLQEAVNHIFRVEEAGFTKRFGSRVVGKIAPTPGDPSRRLPLHTIDLSDTEKYALTIDNGTPHVLSLIDGAAHTITVDALSASYITTTNDLDLAFVTILDYTLVVNRTVTTAMKADVTPTGASAVIFHVKDGREGLYTLTVDGVSGSFTASSTPTDWDVTLIATTLRTALATALGGSYTVILKNPGLIIVTKPGHTISTSGVADPTGGASVLKLQSDDYVTSTDLLPAYAVNGMIVLIGPGGTGTPTFYMKFVETVAGTYSGYWDETIKEGIAYKIDPAKMPQAIIRNNDATFTVQPLVWGDRIVGDGTSVPDPEFIGLPITDIAFTHDRLALASGENWTFSTSGDYFNFWPRKSTIALDSDPFGRRGSSNRVARQRFGMPFRKTFWTTSDRNQFEISSADIFTPKKVVMDPTTAVVASPYCRPEQMGEMLYFTTWNGNNAMVLEYQYNALTLVATAPEITKHVRGYVPHPIRGLTADPPTGNLFAWSSVRTDTLWVWTTFFDADKRQQSAWSTWVFPGALIHAASVVVGKLYLMVTRSDGVWIEVVSLADGANASFPTYQPRVDRGVQIGGTYDAGTGRTTFSLPYDPTGGTFVDTFGLTHAFTVASHNVSVAGSVTTAMFGFTYPAHAELSQVYYRDPQGVSILTGSLALNKFTVAHKDTGYYEVAIQQPGRPDEIHKFTARPLGITTSDVGVQPIVYGVFQKGVAIDPSRGVIQIKNDTHLPHTITEIVFQGNFNEIVRQG